MKVFRQLLDFWVDRTTPSASLYKIVTLLEELDVLNAQLNADELAGFFLQAAMDQSDALHTDFEQRVKIEMVQSMPRTNNRVLRAPTVPTFDWLIQNFHAVKTLLHHQKGNERVLGSNRAVIGSSNPATLMAAWVKHQPGQPPADDTSGEELAEENAFRTAGMRREYYPRLNPAYHGFWSFYPIVVPPGHTPVYPTITPPAGPPRQATGHLARG